MKQLVARDFIYISLCVVLVTFAIIERVFEKDMLNWSNKVAVSWQAHNSWFQQNFMWFASYPLLIAALGIPVMYEICIGNDKVSWQWMVFYFTQTFFISANAKLLYHQIRPFMMENGPEGYDRSYDYGLPSGHSWTSTCVSLYIWDKLLNRKGLAYKHNFFNVMSTLEDKTVKEGNTITNINNNYIPDFTLKNQDSDEAIDEQKTLNLSVYLDENPIQSLFKKILICSLLILFTAWVMISRVYQGAHSIPQILLGFLYGYVWSAGLIFYFRDKICLHFLTLLQNKYSFGPKRVTLLVCNTIALLLTTGTSVLFYYISLENTKDERAEAMKIIEQIWEKNNEDPQPHFKLFEAKHLDHALYFILFFAMIYVFVLPGRTGYVYNPFFFKDQWCKKFFIRLLTMIQCASIPLFVIKLQPPLIFKTEEYFGQFMQTKALGLMTLPLFYPYLASHLYKWCNIQVTGDLMNFN